MIDFQQSGADVKITIDSGVGKFVFTHNCTHGYLAGLMRTQYEQHVVSVLEKITRDAYNQGWKDAKAKTKKATWFKGWW